jgi:hypothetical protein
MRYGHATQQGNQQQVRVFIPSTAMHKNTARSRVMNPSFASVRARAVPWSLRCGCSSEVEGWT